MSETGRNIVEGFRELRKFCNQLSLLFRTADGMMQKAGWTIPRTSVLGSGSGAVEQPNMWLPFDFSRFYQHATHLHVLSYIAVVLDDPMEENKSVVNKALLYAGWFDYGVGKKCAGWKPYFCRAHLWMRNRKDNGTLSVVDHPQSEWGNADMAGIKRVTTFSQPLDEIFSSETLAKKIVQPLLDAVPKDSKAAVSPNRKARETLG